MKIFAVPFLLAALVGSAAAQEDLPDPPMPAPVLEAQLPEPEPVAPAQAAGNAGNSLEDRPIEDRLEYPRANGNVIGALYSELTGKRVLVSSAAAPVEISFVQNPPLTHGEAARLLKKAALMEGLVFVPSGENVEKLVLATQGPLNPKQAALPVITDPLDLPEGDQVVSYVMTLDYIKPDELVRTFTQVVGQFSPHGSIAPVPNASAVILTENSALIRSLLELKEQIDVPSAQVGTRFVKVQFADVEMLAEILNEILNAQKTEPRSAGVERAQTQAPEAAPAPENAAAAAAPGGPRSGSAGEDTPIQIVPDTRTNQIFLLGRPVDLVFVEGLIRQFDAPSDQRNYLRRKLRYLSVSDFLPVAQSALERTYGTDAGTASAGGGPTRQGGDNRFQQNSNQGGGRNFGRGGAGGGFGGAGGGMGGGGMGGMGGMAGNTLNAPNVNNAPEPIVVGRTLLVADNITNSIVVQGPPASVEAITQLLDQLDVKADQVMISTVFGQLSLDNTTEFGVDFLSTIAPDADRGVAGQTRGGNPLVDPLSLVNPTTFPGGDGLNVYARIGGDFYAYVRALQRTGRFNVISRPTIFTGNNQRGVISSGQRIAVPTNTFTGSGNNSGLTQSTNIEYRDVVLSLEVIPLVNSRDEVTLTISLLNDEIVGSQIIDGNDIPTIGTRELQTTVTVPNNSTVVLGGLITTTDRESMSGVPVLSSIPVLGRLFSSTSMEEDRSELLIFIQPKIVNDDATLLDAQVDMDARYEISDGVRVFSDGPGVLPARIPADGKGAVAVPVAPVQTLVPVEAEEVRERRPNAFFRRRR